MSSDACTVCAGLPDRLTADTLHEPAAFPDAARRLEVVAGERWEGQVQRCPGCGAHYLYTYDHDSESGVGYGYTDETLERLFRFEALDEERLRLCNVSARVTGAMLGTLIRDLIATGRPPVERIVALDIGAPGFGAAPEELGLLTAIRLIRFRPGTITGLPASIGRLSELDHLWIAGNPICELPAEIADLPALSEVDLGGTAIGALPPELTRGRVRFHNYESNVVPPDWRAVFVAEYRLPLIWLAQNGAAIERFESGAWSHEDRYDLTVSLPALSAGALRAADLSPFQVAVMDEAQIVLEADGRAGADQITVRLRT